jgi:glycosyltransferase involved in cell wall biosynthesis
VKLVTIYIPTHNRSALLRRAVASALAQSYPAIEVLVVSDGSTDDTLGVLADLQVADARLRFFAHEQNRGAGAARNTAIQNAQGAFVTGLDDDDLLAPGHVAGLLDRYESKYAFVCSSRLEVYSDRRVPNRLDVGVITLEALLHYNKVGNQVLAETSRVRDMGGFDESLPAFQDYDLWVRMVEAYGPALRTAELSYEVWMEHPYERISDSNERRLRALGRFELKHARLMCAAHHRSIELMRHKFSSQRFGLRDLVRLTCPGNAKAAVSLYFNTNFPLIQRVYHRLLGLRPCVRRGLRSRAGSGQGDPGPGLG